MSNPTGIFMAALATRMLAKTEQFNREIVNLPVPKQPTLLSERRAAWTATALTEEVEEFAHACKDEDILEAADGLIDLVYFALGRLVEMGIPPQALFEEVQRANMGKVQGALSKRPDSLGFDAVKPEGWMPPDHSRLLEVTQESLKEYEQLKADAKQREALSPVWKRLQELREKKGSDYNNIPGGRDAYFPYGHMSYGHMVNTKCLRIQSLLNKAKDGKEINFESLLDTVEDLINYATYWAEAMRDGRLSQDGKQ
ncbi:nucleotide pyrophosphohydrolase [Pseudomonas phage ZQG1]|nr:nucleotide pyrophosphohydrolase [Pseudomonas phage ZQG1]